MYMPLYIDCTYRFVTVIYVEIPKCTCTLYIICQYYQQEIMLQLLKNYHSDFTLKYGIDQRSNLHLLFANKPIYIKQVCSEFNSHYL